MSLKDFNRKQLSEIKKFLKSRGYDPNNETVEVIEIEIEWIKNNSESFRKKYGQLENSRSW